MNRSVGPARKKRIPRKGVPRTRKAVPRKNAKRAKRLFAEDFGSAEYVAHIRSLPCALCGVGGYSEAAHVKARGAGGKASDLVPLCGPHYNPWGRVRFGCHHDYDSHEVANYERIRLKQRAAELWLAHTKGETDA